MGDGLMRFLLFTLYAPMGSFGEIAVGERRMSWARPGRSAVLGLVAAAQGIERTDEAAHQRAGGGSSLRGQDGCAGPAAHRLPHRPDSEGAARTHLLDPERRAGVGRPQYGALGAGMAGGRLLHRGAVAASWPDRRSRRDHRMSTPPAFRALRRTQVGAVGSTAQSRHRRGRNVRGSLRCATAERRRTDGPAALQRRRDGARRHCL